MIIKLRETRTHKVQNETINGINIVAFLKAADPNITIDDTGYGDDADFDPSAINISVELKRDEGDVNILNTNLGLLAAYNTLVKNGALWRRGITSVQPAADVKHECARSVFIWFGGHINVAGNDELLITITPTKTTFGAQVDVSDSMIQLETNQSIGVEVGVPQFRQFSIQASSGEDTVQIGDNCLRLALMSFETNPVKTIFTSCSLSSDRLDWTKNEQELMLKHFDNFAYNASEKYLDSLAITANPLYYPHSRMIHDRDEIDKAKVKFTMQPANVLNTKNYVCYTTYVTSDRILAKARNLKEKHAIKDDAKVPLNLKTS